MILPPRLTSPAAVQRATPIDRVAAHLSLKGVADALGSWPDRISELELRLHYDTDLGLRYEAMLGSGDPASSDAKNAA